MKLSINSIGISIDHVLLAVGAFLIAASTLIMQDNITTFTWFFLLGLICTLVPFYYQHKAMNKKIDSQTTTITKLQSEINNVKAAMSELNKLELDNHEVESIVPATA